MPPDLEHRPLEAEHILATLDDVGPSTLTSCPGWTSHQVAAHIAGNYQEVRRHAEAFSAGHPLQHTRSYEEREPPFLELTHSPLLERLEREQSAMRQALAEVLEQDGDATLQWTGRTVALSGFPTHMRSEDAFHRWDLLGDDDLGAGAARAAGTAGARRTFHRYALVSQGT